MRLGKNTSEFSNVQRAAIAALALVHSMLAMPVAASPAAFARAGAFVQPGYSELLHLAFVVPPPSIVRRESQPERDLFGTVALRARGLAARTKWERVLAERADDYLSQPCPGNAAYCGGNWTAWRSLIEAASTLSINDRLDVINRGVNRLVRHTDDIVNDGVSDHWATLAETVRRGRGDCEDFATAKMWLLAALGIPLDKMQLVVLKDKWRQRPHAVLAVHMQGRTYILDNLMNSARRADELTHYIPVYSLSRTASFVHGVRVTATDLALQPGSALAPLPPARPAAARF